MSPSPINNKLVFVFQAVLLSSSSYSYVNGENATTQLETPNPSLPYEQEASSPPKLRRQAIHEDISVEKRTPKTGSKAEMEAFRFSHVPTKTYRRRRTTIFHISVEEPCDYIALQCLRAFQTGRVCARTVYNKYFTFKNYCMLVFTNCRERYEAWQAIHMGDCLKLKPNPVVFFENDKDSGVMNGYYLENKSYE